MLYALICLFKIRLIDDANPFAYIVSVDYADSTNRGYRTLRSSTLNELAVVLETELNSRKTTVLSEFLSVVPDGAKGRWLMPSGHKPLPQFEPFEESEEMFFVSLLPGHLRGLFS
jgi:hypothetical protein